MISHILLPLLLGFMVGFGGYASVITYVHWKQGYDFEWVDFVIGLLMMVVGLVLSLLSWF
jgi:hypothetical protein